MLYPLNPDCETQPRVTMQDITLKNITSEGGILPAGIIRCNETNPCTGFHFEDVKVISKFWDFLGMNHFITEFVEGTSVNVYPEPGFKKPGYYNDPKNRVPDQSSFVAQTA